MKDNSISAIFEEIKSKISAIKGVQFNPYKPAVAKDFGINAANQCARVFCNGCYLAE